MNTPLFTWASIVGLFIVILIVRFIVATHHLHRARRHHLVELQSEREEFFLPGDPNPRKAEGYDYDDFDDL